MASPIKRMRQGLSLRVNQGGTARLFMPCPLKRSGYFFEEVVSLAIRHLVLMRLKPGVFTAEAQQDYRNTFAALKAALPEEILDARVYPNVIDRPQNMTVMIEMILKDEASLPRYLQHPLHQEIGKRYNPFVEAIASFDCEVDP